MRTGRPRISIIMGAYNAQATLPAALDSIAAQTYTNWELIVCDDASTDETWTVLQAFAEAHPSKVRLLRNDQNRRLSYTLNRCLELVSGEYVARMDADDLSEPGRLERQLAVLETNPHLDVVGCAMRRFDDTGAKDVLRTLENPSKDSLRRGVPFAHATILMKKSVYDELGGYVVSKRTARSQDRDLWFRFYAAGKHGVNIKDPLYLVREDLAAVSRRTPRTRYNAWLTTMHGYKLLGFPWYAYFSPTLELIKIVAHPRLVMLYRRCQYLSERLTKKRQRSGSRLP